MVGAQGQGVWVHRGQSAGVSGTGWKRVQRQGEKKETDQEKEEGRVTIGGKSQRRKEGEEQFESLLRRRRDRREVKKTVGSPPG